MHYYPVYLNLQDRRCVVVGGGRMAEEKVKGLLDAGARVMVIAPQLTPQLEKWVGQGTITHIRRDYQPGDLAGAFLVISAADDRATHAQVWQEATAQSILLNAVDDPAHCTFIAPSILRRGDLAIAISTGGKAPAVAVRLRQQLEHMIGPEYGRFLEAAGHMRAPLAARHPDFEQRRARWYRLVDSDVLDLFRRGDDRAARQRMSEILGVEADE